MGWDGLLPALTAHLHDIVVHFNTSALHDAKVPLKVALASVVVRNGAVRGAVEENTSAGVVLDHVVVHLRTACRHGQARTGG